VLGGNDFFSAVSTIFQERQFWCIFVFVFIN